MPSSGSPRVVRAWPFPHAAQPAAAGRLRHSLSEPREIAQYWVYLVLQDADLPTG